MQTEDRIISYIQKNKQASPEELTNSLGISKRAVFKQLKKLLDNKTLKKVGMPPKVYYIKAETDNFADSVVLDEVQSRVIDQNFLTVTPTGEYLEGVLGFCHWCKKGGFDIKQFASQYVSTVKEYSRLRRKGLINGSKKLKDTFKKVFLDGVFYIDFYSIPTFGKTKLGQKLLYAKQSQNKRLIRELSSEMKKVIENFIKERNIIAVGFIPPSVKREVQLMRELEKALELSLPKVKIVKVKTPIIVPQKTLSKLEDRIQNASETLIVDDSRSFKNILLLDDAVGSGATLNEVAKKLKEQEVAKEKVYGIAITGSVKEFDVISEV